MHSENYQHQFIEYKVQNFWKLNNTFHVKKNIKKKKFYCLTMLPYPSGKLHMGHVRNYTAGDVLARFNRHKGKNVLHPIGWDAFGLPAELAAQNNKISPKIWTYKNIQFMKKQLQNLGFSYDWKREISTCNINYYKWEQWFFIELYNNGLIYKKDSYVNWCNTDYTVLANEQVIEDKCWRCNNKIQIKKINQWFIRITDYAEELLNDLKILNKWPEKVKNMQKNWIGKKQGFEVNFFFYDKKKTIKIIGKQYYKNKNYLSFFTPYLALIMGVTFITISLDHPLTNQLSKTNKNIKNFINKCLFYNNIYKYQYKQNKKKVLYKKGINTELLLIHPITKKLLPLWITNTLALYDIFNQAISWGIPAHYKESYLFAKKYKLEIYPFIKNIKNIREKFIQNNEQDKIYYFNYVLYKCKEYFFLNYLDAEKKIFKKLYFLGKCHKIINYKIRDWLISRQRSWGVPIPILLNKKNNYIFKAVKNLPLKLKYKSFLNKNKNWLPEKDTLDTFFQSSWYYARYTCPNFKKGMLNLKHTNYWLPIDQYIGGIEHSILHLMYFRFFNKLMKEMNLLTCIEPANSLLCQGMVLSHTYCFIDKKKNFYWISNENIIKIKDKNTKNEVILDNKGRLLTYMGICKMSKSKNNGVDPNLIVDRYGADAVRLFVMFAAPIKMDFIWDESGLKGMYRFLNKVWNIIYKHITIYKKYIYVNKEKILNINKLFLDFKNKNIWNISVDITKKVFNEIDKKQSFNTAIAFIMTLFNEIKHFIYKSSTDWYIMQKILENFIIILYPFAPHISFHLWEKLTGNNNIDKILWPNITKIKEAIKIKKTVIFVQINNKFKEKIYFSFFDIKEKEKNKKLLLKKIKLDKYLLNNKKIINIIWIKNKIINFIIK